MAVGRHEVTFIFIDTLDRWGRGSGEMFLWQTRVLYNTGVTDVVDIYLPITFNRSPVPILITDLPSAGYSIQMILLILKTMTKHYIRGMTLIGVRFIKVTGMPLKLRTIRHWFIRINENLKTKKKNWGKKVKSWEPNQLSVAFKMNHRPLRH